MFGLMKFLKDILFYFIVINTTLRNINSVNVMCLNTCLYVSKYFITMMKISEFQFYNIPEGCIHINDSEFYLFLDTMIFFYCDDEMYPEDTIP